MTAPSTEVVTRTPAQELISRIRTDQFREQVALALPDGVSADRFTRAAVTALAANPEIAKCESDSIFNALLRSAQDGLLPDGREAALVIFRDNKAGVDKAQYIPMVGGLRKLAGQYGWNVRTVVVYQHDPEFEVEQGLDARIKHVPARPGADRGGMIAAYAIAVHRDGRREFEVMTGEEIEKVRQTSKSKDTGPWKTWPDRMWEKTVGKRLIKKLALGDPHIDARLLRLIEISDDPVAALYGNGTNSHPVIDARVPGELGPGESQQAGTGAAESPVPVPGDEQSDARDTQPPATVAGEEAQPASPPTAADNEDDPPQPGQPQPAVGLEAALATVVPTRARNGKEDLTYKGQPLGQVDDPKWFSWALALKPDRWEPGFRQALEVVFTAKSKGEA